MMEEQYMFLDRPCNYQLDLVLVLLQYYHRLVAKEIVHGLETRYSTNDDLYTLFE